MKRSAAAVLLLGIALFTAVLVWQGVGDIGEALAEAGWGLAAVTAWHLVPLVIDSHAWRLLFSRPRPAFVRIVWARWIGESINGLLPVAQVGGDIAKARLLALRGENGAEAGATVVVDTTLAGAAQMLFALIGVVLLLVVLGRPELAWGVALGIALMAGLFGLFYKLQRDGLFGRLAGWAARMSGGRTGLDFIGNARSLDEAIAAIYRAPRLVARAACWRLAGWLAGVGEVWLGLYFLDSPVGWVDALMLEALVQAVRGAAFMIPGALGVQEGGYVLFTSLIGLAPDTGLALALIRRVRELSLGLPGLIVWQWCEGAHFSRRHAKRNSIKES